MRPIKVYFYSTSVFKKFTLSKTPELPAKFAPGDFSEA